MLLVDFELRLSLHHLMIDKGRHARPVIPANKTNTVPLNVIIVTTESMMKSISWLNVQNFCLYKESRI